MLYLGIDQHSKQVTVCVRDEAGKVVLRRQVSTRPARINAFFRELVDMDGQFMAILEVCGFNDWLIEALRKNGCREVVLIHPQKASKNKTDRRDANKLCELLWLNRNRLADGAKPQGIRRVYIPSEQEQQDRQLTALRKRVAQQRTRTLNKIHRILHRHNLMWQYPTKTFQTKRGRAWLQERSLPPVDRLEMDLLLGQWDLWEKQLKQLDERIADHVDRERGKDITSPSQLLGTAPGVSCYSGLALASRIGPIERFPRPRSLAHYFGLTPGCRNSGNTQDRLGSITKEGSGMARFILGQLVLHVLKQDKRMRQWYRRIKGRRGSKIARVAVMRRLATIFWHMLTYREPYYAGGPPRLRLARGKASCPPAGRAAALSGKGE
jgi:transposase